LCYKSGDNHNHFSSLIYFAKFGSGNFIGDEKTC
jgi:hypothetical protein